jgi:diguanylate cyclase (GGDEF)-like protein/PAS domain S-box-containing protein
MSNDRRREKHMSEQDYQVLLVTDNDQDARFLEYALRKDSRATFVPLRAQDLGEAMKLLATRPIDAVVLDSALPDTNCVETCLKIHSSDATMPIIATQETADEGQAKDILTAGAQDVLLKQECAGGNLSRAIRFAVKRAKAVRELSASESLLQSVLQNVNEGVIVAGRNEKLLLVNPAARELLGIGSAAGLPTDIFGMYEPDTVTRIRDRERPMARAIRGETLNDLEIFHRNPNAPNGRFLSVSGRPLKDAAGNITGGIVSFRDVTGRKRVEDELAHLSLHDGLTGIPNRAFFLETLRKSVARARRAESRVAVLLLDLDRFKQVNDRLGHEFGNALLVDVARRLTDGLRAGDFVARLGGDEFVILFENFGHDEHAAGLADKITDVLAPVFRLEGQEVSVSASIGISTFPECGDDAGSLMKTADVAMYRAKESGRNTYHFYSRSVHAEMSRRSQLEADLREAMRQDHFDLEYQPIADLRNGRIAAVEALLRWNHSDHGQVRPLEFIPILEATGLMNRVGEWVLASACAQVKEWQRTLNRPDLGVAVNLSYQQLLHRRIVDQVHRILTNAGLEASMLTVEINEATVLENPRVVREQLQLLAREGVRIALDDFGTGYSSLQAIRQLPLSTIKIDRSLVMSLPTDPEDVAVVDAVLRFAEDLDLEVIAEGVEAQAQLDFLAERGCALGQGYLISPPLPVAAVDSFVSTNWRAA